MTLHEVEKVRVDVDRIKVPGGWLYRCYNFVFINQHLSEPVLQSVTFVPEPS